MLRIGCVVLGSVQLIHLLLRSRNEHITGRALLNLGLERTGGIKIIRQRDVFMLCFVIGLNLIERFGHRRRRKNDQFGLFTGIRVGVCICSAAAGQARCHAHCQRQQRCYRFASLFHLMVLLLKKKYFTLVRSRVPSLAKVPIHVEWYP